WLIYDILKRFFHSRCLVVRSGAGTNHFAAPPGGTGVSERLIQPTVVREVGRRIRNLRTSRPSRMTQEDLSERARISVSFLSMIERGERSPHLETLAAIAEA